MFRIIWGGRVGVGNLISKIFNPDQTKNSHANCVLTFLKENRAIILNGRIMPENNNFTFVSPNHGSSVRDYQFCPIYHMQYCTEMKTLWMSEVVNSAGLHPPLNMPDHSILIGTFDISCFNLFRHSTLKQSNFNEHVAPTRAPKKI